MTDKHTADRLAVTPERREQLVLDVIDAADFIARGEWSFDDAVSMLGRDELLHGFLLYSQLLEAGMLIARAAGTVEAVRESARVSARQWRQQ